MLPIVDPSMCNQCDICHIQLLAELGEGGGKMGLQKPIQARMKKEIHTYDQGYGIRTGHKAYTVNIIILFICILKNYYQLLYNLCSLIIYIYCPILCKETIAGPGAKARWDLAQCMT